VARGPAPAPADPVRTGYPRWDDVRTPRPTPLGVLGAARVERREGSSNAIPARGLGLGATTSRSRPPTVTPIASGLSIWSTSFRVPPLAGCAQDAGWRRGGRGPRGQDCAGGGFPRVRLLCGGGAKHCSAPPDPSAARRHAPP